MPLCRSIPCYIIPSRCCSVPSCCLFFVLFFVSVFFAFFCCCYVCFCFFFVVSYFVYDVLIRTKIQIKKKTEGTQRWPLSTGCFPFFPFSSLLFFRFCFLSIRCQRRNSMWWWIRKPWPHWRSTCLAYERREQSAFFVLPFPVFSFSIFLLFHFFFSFFFLSFPFFLLFPPLIFFHFFSFLFLFFSAVSCNALSDIE